MKEIVKTSRLAGQLEKLFRMLNEDFFDGELETPIITIQSTPRAYGTYSRFDAWEVKGEGRREINIGAGTLDRPIEYTVTTLLHEMCHMLNDTVLNCADTSNRGVYHNKLFKEAAEAHGLVCSRSEKYGWSKTTPSETLIDWILENDVCDILMNRNELCGVRIVGGNTTASGGIPIGTAKPSSTRKLICPCCGQSVRATKAVNILCGDCMTKMVEVHT